MDAAKYIIFDGTSLALPDFPVIFPPFITHDQIAGKFPMCKPISAGQVNISDTGEICVGGESVSLKLKATETDSRLIMRMLKN